MQARRELRGTYQRRESVPRPEGDEEAQVTEEKHASILVDGVEYGDRLGLLVVGIDLWGRPELLELEAHDERSGMVTVEKQGYYPERSLERWLSKKEDACVLERTRVGSDASYYMYDSKCKHSQFGRECTLPRCKWVTQKQAWAEIGSKIG